MFEKYMKIKYGQEKDGLILLGHRGELRLDMLKNNFEESQAEYHEY